MIEFGNQIREENITSFKVYMVVCGAVIIAMTVMVFIVTYLFADQERKVSYTWKTNPKSKLFSDSSYQISRKRSHKMLIVSLKKPEPREDNRRQNTYLINGSILI